MKWKPVIASLALCALAMPQAHALQYSFDGPRDYAFGSPTSQEVVIAHREAVNADRSKSVALAPPGFGSATSYLMGSGEYLTPNLVPGALSGGLVNTLGNENGYIAMGASTPLTGGDPTVDASSGTVNYPTIDTGSSGSSYTPLSTGYTSVTSSTYYSGGHLGTLSIPSLGVNVKVFQGTDNSTLAKGAGHFPDTSIWDGNVCVAGHNRGANCYFGNIHKLNAGDIITLTTKYGTRTYAVSSVNKISETDGTMLASTGDNRVTLFTCVRNEKPYRWCVQAQEVFG